MSSSFGRGGRIPRMICEPLWTGLFYAFVFVVAAGPLLFMWHYWHEARTRGWDWINADSRAMYADGAKTLITASGIAVALIASSAIAPGRAASGVVILSAKVGTVCLISCVCLSLLTILALSRGYERAHSRHADQHRDAGLSVGPEGRLSTVELLCILFPTGAALSCFLVGFLFLGRIVFHL